MALPIGLAIGFGVDDGNQKHKVRVRNRQIADLSTENQALRDQLDQSQNQQACATPWSNFMQFPQLNSSYQLQQQPTTQLLNTSSQLMQLMGQGMGASPIYSGMFGPQTGALSNTTGTVQNLFGQMQNLMQLSGGLYNAMNAYQQLQPTPGFVQPTPGFVQPAQGFVQPTPGFVQPTPGFVQPAQGFVQPTPGFVQPTPGFVPPAQGFVPPTPGFVQNQGSAYGQYNDDRAIMTTLGKNASKVFPGGAEITMSKIQDIAKTGRCPDGSEAPADLKMACQELGNRPALFEKLQSTVKASKGKSDTDGWASVQDLQMLMTQLKEASPNSSTILNPNTQNAPYSPNSAYGSSFVNALMGHLQSTGVNPYMLNLLQQPGMQQPMLAH